MKYYHRIAEAKIKEALNRKEAIFILGARQVGKTTLMKNLIKELKYTLYLDLENPEYCTLINKGVNEFISYLEKQILQADQKYYIFIDEIQYADDFSSLIKYMVDHYSEKYKLILSGSSSLLIRKKFKESLVGRKKIFELFPLTFSEFCTFNNEPKLGEELERIDTFDLRADPLRFDRIKITNLLKEYLVFGGFPQVALEKNQDDKIDCLKDIVTSFVIKDIRHIFNLEKIDQFNHLIKLLAVFAGKELNFTKLSNETKLHKQTLLHYINALESSYVIKLIQPFHRNFASELRKTPKCYFLDNGLRNFLVSNFSDVDFRSDRGELLENFVFSQLQKKAGTLTKINYWRTKSKLEIDFILQQETRLTALEVKWNTGSKNHLKKFEKSYPDAETYLISMLQEFDAKQNVIAGYLV